VLVSDVRDVCLVSQQTSVLSVFLIDVTFPKEALNMTDISAKYE
jgi:hypothetical protein